MPASGPLELSPVIVRARSFGVTCNGVTDDSAALTRALQFVANFGGGTVLLDAGTVRTNNNKVTVPDKVVLRGAGRNATFIDPGTLGGGTEAVLMGECSGLEDLTVKSTTATAVENSATWELGSRAIKFAEPGAWATNVTVENASMGFTVEGTSRINLIGCWAINCKSRYGAAAGFHITGSKDVLASASYIELADRIFEVEDGTENVLAINGRAKDCAIGKYATAPAYGTGAGEFLNYSFGLDAHNHNSPSNTPACRNIVYDTWTLENCGVAITCTQDSTNPVENIAYRSITVDGISDTWTTSRSAIYIEGPRCVTVDNLVVRGTPTSREWLGQIAGTSNNIVFRGGAILTAGTDLASDVGKLFTTTTNTRGVKFCGGMLFKFDFSLTGVSAAIILTGKDGTVGDVIFDNVKGYSSALVQLDGSGNKVDGAHFYWTSGNGASGGATPTSIINMRANGSMTRNCTFDGDGTQNNVRVSNEADNCLIIGNRMLNANAAPVAVRIEANSVATLVAHNYYSQSGAVETDLGTSTTFSRNNKAGTISAA